MAKDVQRRRARYKQATFVGLILITPVDNGGRGQVLSTSTKDRRLLITLGVQLCMSTARWSIRREAASSGPSALGDMLLFTGVASGGSSSDLILRKKTKAVHF